MKVKDLEDKELKFELDDKEIMDFYQETKFVVLLSEEGEVKVLVLEKEEKEKEKKEDV